MKTKLVTGEYNLDGYTVSILANGKVVSDESFGNSPQDSTSFERDSHYALSLRQLRSACIKTGKEIAAERQAKWSGCKRVERCANCDEVFRPSNHDQICCSTHCENR
jgi:hypothetical protein